MYASWAINHFDIDQRFPWVAVFALFIGLSIVAGCVAFERTPTLTQPEPIQMSERRAAFQYVGPDTLNGTLHSLTQFKCPGITISESGSQCVRHLAVYTPTATSPWPEARLRRDTVRLHSAEAYVVERANYRALIPDSTKGADGTVQLVARDIAATSVVGLIHGEEHACATTKTRKYDYARCDLAGVPAIRLRVSKQHLEQFAHPLRSVTGAIPITGPQDSVDVLVLVEPDSSVR